MRAWIEISKQQLIDNFTLITKDLPKNLKYFCVIKDNGFGHDANLIANIALKFNATYLMVSCLFEALELVKNSITKPIFILYERFDDELEICVRHNFTLQVQSLEKAKKIAKIATKLGKTVKIHLKVDTGLGRYGVAWKEAAKVYAAILKIPNIELEGIMTHFAQSDEPDKSYAELQNKRFKKVLDNISKLPKYIHSCNSGGFLDLPDCYYNAVRIGILNTGIYPSKSCRRIKIQGKTLKPIMSVKTKITSIKELQKGNSVGYGMRFTAPKKMITAVLPMGYGDGYPRIVNKGKVIIRGEYAPIIGGVSMDAIIVDITKIPQAKVTDEVVIIGEQKGKSITVHDLGSWGHTLCYDQLTQWSKRMEH